MTWCVPLSGDCLDIIPLLGEAVDAVVTDPPYHLVSMTKRFGSPDAKPSGAGYDGAHRRMSRGFMGKGWDGGDIAFQPETWHAIGEAMKPGAHLVAFGGSRTFHRLAVAIEDAGFELRDTLMWVYGCLDDETEALTQRGWIGHADLRPDDKVLQWDSAADALSWTRPQEVHRYPFDGHLVAIDNRNTSQRLTPNHRVYAKVRRHSRHEKPTLYEVLDAETIDRRPSNWQVDLPLASYLAEGELIDPAFAYLAGWWMTDAWCHVDGKACMFSQSKPGTLAKLRDALRGLGASEYVKPAKQDAHNDEHTFYLTGPIADRLRAMFPDRRLPWSVLGWDRAARERLFAGLMDGDGTRPAGQYCLTFWSQDAERRAVFQALATTLGFRSAEDDPNGAVYVNVERRTTQVQGRHRSQRVRYTGTVWCVTVPTGAFVVRRAGRPFITGNSGFPKSHDVSKGIDKALGQSGSVEAVGAAVKRMIPGADQNRNGSWIKDNGREYQPGHYVPSTPEASAWEGWGTALKPAHEPVLCCAKPVTVEQHFAMIVAELTREIMAWKQYANGADRRLAGLLATCDEAAGSVLVGARMRSLASIGIAWSAEHNSTYRGLVSLDLRRMQDCFALSHVAQSASAAEDVEKTIPLGEAGDTLMRLLDISTSVVTDGMSENIVSLWLGWSEDLLSRANKFTIETATRLTTVLRTSNFSRLLSITAGIGGSSPNVAFEPIILARKPLEGTVAANVLRHGVGGLNIDGCRIAFAGEADERESKNKNRHADFGSGPMTNEVYGKFTKDRDNYGPPGRWPANVLHDGSPEVLALFPETGRSSGGVGSPFTSPNGIYGKFSDVVRANSGGLGDTGSAARYFAEFPFTEDDRRFFYSAKAGKADRAGSKHPTVKPQALMRWLCRLITPPGGLILDPFAGSGSTGEAARAEGFRSILIEKEPEYQADIRRRIEAAA
jgi:DNA modification methylase